MPAYSELSLMLAVTAVSWQTQMKFGYFVPASENTETSKFKAEDTSSSFLRNVRIYQCYNFISHTILISIFAGVRTSDLREQDLFVYCI